MNMLKKRNISEDTEKLLKIPHIFVIKKKNPPSKTEMEPSLQNQQQTIQYCTKDLG